MKKRSFLLLFVLAAASLWHLYEAPERKQRQTQAALENAIRKGLIETRWTPLLERSIKLIQAQYPALPVIHANAVARDSEISLVVINPDSTQYPKELGDLVHSVAYNMLVVGDRYIVADERFLGLLLLNSLVGFSGELQKEERTQAHDQTFDKGASLRTFNAIAMLRLANIEAAFGGGGDRSWEGHLEIYEKIEHATTLKEYARQVKEAGYVWGAIDYPLEPILVYSLGGDDGGDSFPFGDAIAVPFASVVTPMLLHEIGHLTNGYEGSFVGEINTQLDQELMRLAKREEERADAYAVATLRNKKGEVRYRANIGKYDYDLSRGTFTAGKILEDMAFVKIFHRFRNMNTQMIGSQIEYAPAPCGESKRGFFDMNLISNMRESLFPILTQEEFEAIGLAGRTGGSTHPHLYARAKEFQAYSVSELAKTYEPESTHASHVRRLLTGDTENLTKAVLNDAYRADIERIYPGATTSGVALESHFLGILSEAGLKELMPAVCPFAACKIFSDGNGMYFELGLRDDRVVYASLYIRVFSRLTKDWDEKWGDPTPKSEQDFARKLAVFLAANAWFSGGELQPNDGRLVEYAKKHLECGFASLVYSGDLGTIRVSAYDNDKSVYLTFVSR